MIPSNTSYNVMACYLTIYCQNLYNLWNTPSWNDLSHVSDCVCDVIGHDPIEPEHLRSIGQKINNWNFFKGLIYNYFVIVIFVSYWKSYTIKPSIWFFFQWVFPLQNKEYLEGEWSCADGRSWLWIHKVPTIGIALGFVRCFYLMALWPVHLCVSTIYMWCCKLSFRLFEWLVSFDLDFLC